MLGADRVLMLHGTGSMYYVDIVDHNGNIYEDAVIAGNCPDMHNAKHYPPPPSSVKVAFMWELERIGIDSLHLAPTVLRSRSPVEQHLQPSTDGARPQPPAEDTHVVQTCQFLVLL